MHDSKTNSIADALSTPSTTLPTGGGMWIFGNMTQAELMQAAGLALILVQLFALSPKAWRAACFWADKLKIWRKK